MDPLRIAARAIFVYAIALALIRASGKRSIKQADVRSFVVAVVLGDLFDDALWAEVPMAEFVVAAGVLTLTHALFALDALSRGLRSWHRAFRGAAEQA